jgi:hypothetical protein
VTVNGVAGDGDVVQLPVVSIKAVSVSAKMGAPNGWGLAKEAPATGHTARHRSWSMARPKIRVKPGRRDISRSRCADIVRRSAAV